MRPRRTFSAPLVALDLFEERWTLAIVWALREEPLAFNALQRTVGSINQSVLKARLDHLEDLGLVTRTVHSLQPPRTSYALAGRGHSLLEVISEATAWVRRYWPSSPMESENSTTKAIHILQQKWKLHIVRVLLDGPQTFGELQASIEGINHTVLAQRLEVLEHIGVLRKTAVPEQPKRSRYEPTEAGRDFQTVVDAITVWADRELKAALPSSVAPQDSVELS